MVVNLHARLCNSDHAVFGSFFIKSLKEAIWVELFPVGYIPSPSYGVSLNQYLHHIRIAGIRYASKVRTAPSITIWSLCVVGIGSLFKTFFIDDSYNGLASDGN